MTKLLKNGEFAKNLKRLRLAAGLSQEQTVLKLQLLGSPISRSTYSLIESGKGNLFVGSGDPNPHWFHIRNFPRNGSKFLENTSVFPA